ncbi:calcium-binding protein [Aestuariicoccus sp. MJ-SS9]|uniref:calcium-binding protein n=1 Tax=Aestuariicoccus sp. MJ-SS9 TaxID=3079855 RepID=UPI00290DCF95|nr:calcium-binding protein [Aestuariicoccus sp. MJ-SS9]MDU8914084.1 calcium-binding protein [Aestuariicoccus sp. MJ-SS9]
MTYRSIKAAEPADHPNDTSTTAVLPLDTPVQSNFGQDGDRDWFRVELEGGEIYTATLTLAEPVVGFGGFEGRAELFVGNNENAPYFPGDPSVSALYIDEGETTSVAVLSVETSGFYYLDLETFFGTGDYSVELNRVENDLPSFDSGVVLEPGVPYASNFYGPNDTDGFTATLVEGAVYRFTFDLPIAPYVGLEGEGYPQTDGPSIFISANSNEPNPSFLARASGLHDFSFTNFANAYDYTVTLQEVPQPPDIGDSPETAQALAINETFASRFEVIGGDEDWFALTLDVGMSYKLILTREGQGYWGGSQGVPRLQLLDPEGTVLYELDQSYGIELESDVFTPDSSGTYYAAVIADQVNGFEIDGDPDYALTLLSGAPETLTGSDGPDVLTGSFAADLIDGGDGNDSLTGDAGDDTILGGGGRDNIAAGEGADSVLGGPGNDRILGGSGNDTLLGGLDEDQLFGSLGNDLIDGGSARDLLWSGEGDDTVIAGSGDDHIGARSGADLIDAGDGDDIVGAGQDADSVAGGPGSDTIYGGFGNDTVSGGEGDDALFGGWGNDLVDGGSGNDTLNAKWTEDTLTGGEGADEFVLELRDYFYSNENEVVITDFAVGEDTLVIAPSHGVGANPVDIALFEGGVEITTGENTLFVDLANGASLTMADVMLLEG